MWRPDADTSRKTKRKNESRIAAQDAIIAMPAMRDIQQLEVL